MRVLVVGNPRSGGGRGAAGAEQVARTARSLGVTAELLLSRHVGHVRRELAVPPAGFDRVLACGGDGLVSEAAAALRGGDLPMAVVPAGRGNDFARALGIPLDLDEATRVALRGEVARVDLGLAGGRAFCTVAGCGLDAEVSRRARGWRLPLPGPATYVIELLRALVRLQAVRVRVEADGVLVEEDALLLAVANTPTYGGGFRIAPRASLRDGLLDACLLRAVSRTRALALLPAVFAGRHEGRAEVLTLRAQRLRVETEPPLPVEADGEPAGGTPLEYACDAACLPVVLRA